MVDLIESHGAVQDLAAAHAQCGEVHAAAGQWELAAEQYGTGYACTYGYAYPDDASDSYAAKYHLYTRNHRVEEKQAEEKQAQKVEAERKREQRRAQQAVQNKRIVEKRRQQEAERVLEYKRRQEMERVQIARLVEKRQKEAERQRRENMAYYGACFRDHNHYDPNDDPNDDPNREGVVAMGMMIAWIIPGGDPRTFFQGRANPAIGPAVNLSELDTTWNRLPCWNFDKFVRSELKVEEFITFVTQLVDSPLGIHRENLHRYNSGMLVSAGMTPETVSHGVCCF